MRISDWSSDVCSSDLPDRGEVADRLFAVPHLAADRLVAVDDLVHALLDGRKVGGREGGLPGEVVVEAVFDGRAEGDLGAGIEFLQIGRASGREREGPYVEVSVVAGSFKTTNKHVEIMLS